VAEEERASYGIELTSTLVGSLVALVAGLLLLALALYEDAAGTGRALASSWELGVVLIAGGTAGAGYLFWTALRMAAREREALLGALELSGDPRILDVGCGRGFLLVEALRRTPGARGVGIDAPEFARPDPGPSGALANARAEGIGTRVALAAADPGALPFRDGSFDIVLSRGALARIRSDESFGEALDEMVRVLKLGGRLGLIVTDAGRLAKYGERLDAGGFDSDVSGSGGPFSVPVVVARRPLAIAVPAAADPAGSGGAPPATSPGPDRGAA
jgi:SAM-dependent methyltransferase